MIIRRFLLTLIAAFVVPLNSYAWELSRNFNSARIGEKADHAIDGFDEAGGHSFYSKTQVAEGNSAAILNVEKGITGWATWGGVIKFPSNLYAGDELWYQMYIYIPSSFRIKTDQGSLKFIRFKGMYQGADGKPQGDGMVDIQILDEGSSNNAFRMIKERAFEGGWKYFGRAEDFQKDRWHKVSVHLTVGHVPVAEGGQSSVKIWLNDELVTDEKSMKTLAVKGAYLDYLYLFTYWNGGAPQDQYLWVDDIRIASTKPEWAKRLDADSGSRPLAPAAKVNVRAGG